MVSAHLFRGLLEIEGAARPVPVAFQIVLAPDASPVDLSEAAKAIGIFLAEQLELEKGVWN